MTTPAFRQEHHSTTSTTTSKRTVPASAGRRPISPQPRAFATRNHDPSDGDAEKLRIYIGLGGAA
jgi:hypothetical protein